MERIRGRGTTARGRGRGHGLGHENAHDNRDNVITTLRRQLCEQTAQIQWLKTRVQARNERSQDDAGDHDGEEHSVGGDNMEKE